MLYVGDGELFESLLSYTIVLQILICALSLLDLGFPFFFCGVCKYVFLLARNRQGNAGLKDEDICFR